MNNDYGFENRKAYLERSRDEHFLNNLHKNDLNTKLPNMQLHKKQRFENTIKMNNMVKENFNRNFNKNI